MTEPNQKEAMTLTVPPPNYVDTRDALHRVARYVITPRRQEIDGRERLMQLPGGFGTPTLGNDTQMRIDGANLVVRTGPQTVSEPISTLRRAGELIGVKPNDATAEPDIPQMGDLDETLAVDTVAATYLGRWFEYTWAVLSALIEDEASTEPSEIVLWSHHLDPAIELLSDDRKASYGGSAGDGSIAEPYLYVAPWAGVEVNPGPYWNAEGYTGATLRVSELAIGDDPIEAGLSFLRHGRDLLAAG